jgi:hypothetical protein
MTDLNPVRVKLDGDSIELPITPDCLIDPATLLLGDRVRCEVAGRRLIIHGRSGGGAGEYTLTPTAGWGLYLNHPSGTEAGSPAVHTSGGFCAFRLTLKNTSGSATSVGGGMTVANGFPLPRIGDFSVGIHSIQTSSPGPIRTDVGAYINSGGGLGLRGPASIGAGELNEVVGMYLTL